jgi:hypothetical protein
MTETTIPTSLTPTGQVSAPELARAQGLNPVDYLRRRGFVYDITDEEGLRAAFDEGQVTYYQGFDPTGPSLHAGHMAGIMRISSASGIVRLRSAVAARPWSEIPLAGRPPAS